MDVQTFGQSLWKVARPNPVSPKDAEKTGCPFCINEPSNRDAIKDRILCETENFIVTPTLGQITPGYLLIIPKGHYSCMGDLPDGVCRELAQLKERVTKELTDKYQKPIFFEHGVCGQTVRHAHLHCVPANVDLTDTVNADYRSSEIGSLKDLKEIFRKEGSYLFFEDKSGHKFVWHTKDRTVKPQYMRIVLANKLGVPERADWKKYPGWEEIAESKKKLKF